MKPSPKAKPSPHILTEQELQDLVDQPKRAYVVYDSPNPDDCRKGYVLIQKARCGVYLSFGTLKNFGLLGTVDVCMDFEPTGNPKAPCITEDEYDGAITTIWSKKPQASA